jgi:hypothetical protein
MELILLSFIAGIIATAAMTLVELVFWRKWKLIGVLEWHENQILISKFFRLDVKKLNFPGIFFLHFLNGGLGGVGLAIAILLIPLHLNMISIYPLGLLYALFLWLLTLAPIHKPITGLDPFNHPLGRGPALASIGGHLLYGLVLGTTFVLEGVWT